MSSLNRFANIFLTTVFLFCTSSYTNAVTAVKANSYKREYIEGSLKKISKKYERKFDNYYQRTLIRANISDAQDIVFVSAAIKGTMPEFPMMAAVSAENYLEKASRHMKDTMSLSFLSDKMIRNYSDLVLSVAENNQTDSPATFYSMHFLGDGLYGIFSASFLSIKGHRFERNAAPKTMLFFYRVIQSDEAKQAHDSFEQVQVLASRIEELQAQQKALLKELELDQISVEEFSEEFEIISAQISKLGAMLYDQ
ncbi:MAG: hypothetical protein HRU09_18085 [Oligoflexales bacterium]|nr:hypothetical protein [Oligoflexales bacterium]